jgi:hypothetical protein
MSYVTFAAVSVVSNETATIRTIAAVVASVFRIGGYAERGYAASFTAELAEGIAIARNGDAYEQAGPAQRKVMFDKAYPTAKRYAEKSVGICKRGDEKGAPILDIMKAESDEQARDLVAGWFFGPTIAAATCDELYEAFGFSTGKKKATPKDNAGDGEKSAGQDGAGAGDAGAGDAPKTQADADVAMANALAFAETVKSVMAGHSPAERKAIALAVIAEMQAALDWTGEQAITEPAPVDAAPVDAAPVEPAPTKNKRKAKELATA